MHRFFTKTILFFSAICLSTLSFGQDGDIDDFIQTEEAISDANKLIQGYIDPFTSGFGAGLNSGWYNTAKTHKSLGFDIGFTAGLAYIPDEDQFYRPNDLGLTYFSFNGTDAPTVFGPNEDPSYSFDPTPNSPNSGDEELISGPPGLGLKDEIGFNATPIIIPQLGIGIYKNTDLKIRWLPEISLGDDSNLKLFGIGVMHDIKQHIPGIKMAPFDWSVMIGYTSITSTTDFVDDFNADNRLLFDTKAWTFQTMVSKKFSVLTLYGGLGYNTAKTDLKLEGQYDVGTGNQSDAIENPINLGFNSNGLRFTAGMRLKFAIFTLHTDYTIQKYNVLSVGMGFAVR